MALLLTKVGCLGRYLNYRNNVILSTWQERRDVKTGVNNNGPSYALEGQQAQRDLLLSR